MEPTPGRRRRIAVPLALAALLVAVAGLFALVNWPRKAPETAAPDNNPPATATSPPAYVAPPSAPPPATSAPPSSPPPATTPPPPRPTATLSFDDAFGRVESAVEAGLSNGEIREDVATDLLNLLRQLANADVSEVSDRVQQLRNKVRQRQGEGADSIARSRATTLQTLLADLNRAAGT